MVKGYTQIPEIEYQETYSLTVHIISVCILMKLATEKDLTVYQMDVKTIYLNAFIAYKIYMNMNIL